MKLVEAVPDAVENVRGLVRDMKNIPPKETKRRELSYKASQDVLKAVGIMPTNAQVPLVANIYSDNRFQIISPVIREILGEKCNDIIDIEADE